MMKTMSNYENSNKIGIREGSAPITLSLALIFFAHADFQPVDMNAIGMNGHDNYERRAANSDRHH